ncbi:hypothetical protein K431DRAFT_84143 [Polychaeton citri CBS 116435]|uniref:Zn(2)-C6 fungal-type domain-containing protein n=1 Tax=Polychaeton citri CBS 116435 TaxID=1314669 RepID=A0A9P4QA65_9PEZI|nr:hypothetical protein K431DRAFT_84143 [Polychaeton citri CBS 116435]
MDKPNSSKSSKKHGRSKKTRQSIARVACNYCRTRKLRCDETRPACSSCSKHGLKCTYDIRDNGESERRNLRSENSTLRKELARLQEAFDPARLHRSNSNESPLTPIAKLNTSHDEHEIDDSPSTGTITSDGVVQRRLCQSTALNLPIDCSDERFQSIAIELLEALASRSDDESTLLLARLRLGERMDMMTLTQNTKCAEENLYSRPTVAIPKPEISQYAHDFTSTPWLSGLFDRSMWMDGSTEQLTWAPVPSEWKHHDTPLSIVSLAPALADYSRDTPFSGAKSAANESSVHQERQRENLFVPTWAMRTMNDPGGTTDPYEGIFAQLQREIEDGTDAEELCGPHAYIGALFDEATFNRAPRLSQVVAGMVKSIKPDNTTPTTSITMHAIMWLHWTLYKWMLLPCPQTYCDMPALIRPTPWQIFAQHSRVYDFIFTPSLREHICQSRYHDMRWLTEACVTVVCDWQWAVADGLCQDSSTNEFDLSLACKAHVAKAESWSLGPSVKQYFHNIEKYIRVRTS